MKTVFVTGSDGVLGRAVVTKLKEMENCRVVTASRQQNHDVMLDIRNAQQVRDIVEFVRPDLTLHLAATFTNDYEEAYAVNVEGARYLLDAIRAFHSEGRVLLVGSAAEYGVVSPEESPLNEAHALNPVSIYGLTKAWQSQIGRLYANSGMNVTIARIFNLDGSGLSERLFVGRLQKQIAEVLSGQRAEIEVGPLSATRDYIGVEQAADQLLAVALLGESGRVYHVASGIPITMRDLLKRHLALHGLDISSVKEAAELSNHVGYDVPVIYADITHTEKLMEVRRRESKW